MSKKTLVLLVISGLLVISVSLIAAVYVDEPLTTVSTVSTVSEPTLPTIYEPTETVHVITKIVTGIKAITIPHGKPTITTVTFEDGETMEFFDTNKTPFRKDEYNTIIYVTHYHAREPLFHQIITVSTMSSELYVAKRGVLYIKDTSEQTSDPKLFQGLFLLEI